MSKQIIIDWQRDGLFVAMGSRRGNSVAIETLVTTGGEGVTGSSTAISTQLFALAKKLDLNKCEATVIAPREVLEFRALTVPRGDVDEVPDMVRFQAQRQMANIGDTWPLDYILLPDQPGSEGISALAATISPAHMAEIEATCSDLGMQLTRVLARPVEIARWGVTLGNLTDTEAALVVSVSETHADLLAVSFGSLVQVRGTRLSSESQMASALVAEIRRTVMAASSFLNNQPITKIVLIASPDIAGNVESQVAEATGASVAVVDPASVLPSQLAERHELAHRASSRIAAIAGVVCNPNPDQRNIIDLRNCKRRMPKKGYKREMIIGGVGVAAVVLFGMYFWWTSHAQLDLQIRAARKLEADMAEQVKKLSPQIKQRQDVDNFLAGSINWLDEMKYIAANSPGSKDVVLTSPSFDFLVDRNSGRGQIVTMAEARTSEQLSKLRENLSDKEHEITGAGPKQMVTRKGEYGWEERETIRIAPRAWDPLAKTAAKDKAAPTSSTKASPQADPQTSPTEGKPAPGEKPEEKAAPAADKPTSEQPTTPVAQSPNTKLPNPES